MFDIGFLELLICGVIALLVLGPERHDARDARQEDRVNQAAQEAAAAVLGRRGALCVQCSNIL